MSRFDPTPLQRKAYKIGGICGLAVLVLLLLPSSRPWHQAGPDNLGHDTVECEACHAPAEGWLGGQVAASLAHWADPGSDAGWFRYQPTGNDQCLDCHDNPEDRHRVERFLEPEFEVARVAAGVDQCVSCHRQHQGNRVSAGQTFCQHCHDDLEMRDDPVDTSHEELVADARWNTCLGCHDFHGNHDGEVPVEMHKINSPQAIQAYFDGGSSPYGYRKLTVMQTMRTKESE